MDFKVLVSECDLVLVSNSAFTYAIIGDIPLNQDHSICGLVLYKLESKQNTDKSVNFDNSALYYVMTSKGCLSIFEFDLEVISAQKNNSS